jgi:uncharacterized membrane protein YgcG
MRTLPVVAALLVACFTASAKSYRAERYDVDLRLDSQGGLDVTETVDFRFIAGPFHYVFREIAATETDGIENVHASMDGVPCDAGTGPGQVEISGTSPVEVRWYFDPIFSGNHTFVVHYRAAGVLRPSPDSQTLIWRVLPQKRGYGIGMSEIVLHYPDVIEASALALNTLAAPFETRSGYAAATLVDTPANQDVILEARFPAGSFAATPPEWQAARERKADASRIGRLAGGAVSAFFLMAACIWMFRIRASVRPAAGIEVCPEDVTSPPDSWPAAIAARLAGKQFLRLGALLELARRGFVRIEERPKSVLMGRQFQVVKSDSAVPLAPHERALIAMVFRPGETAMPIREFFTRQQGNGQFMDAIRAELQAAGLIDEARARARNWLLIAGAIGFAAGALLLALGLTSAEPIAGAVGTVLGGTAFAVAILAVILGGTQTIWSDAGLLASARWKAFARHLTQAACGRGPQPGQSEQERYLPYAAAFGIMAPLLKRQREQGGMELPPWFQALQSADGADADAFTAFTSTCDSASYSGGDGGGGGGDGGASGGGSSGAG